MAWPQTAPPGGPLAAKRSGLLLDAPGPSPASTESLPHTHALSRDGSGERRFLCRGCRYPITDDRARAEIAGAHVHDRMNPAGYVYRIACFRDAPGCVPIGMPSAEFSWFPGCAWRIALCASCRGHLGWSFEGSGQAFYGLIPERLVPDERGRIG